MTLYERIQLYAKNEKISISKIEKECGLGNGTIGKWKDSIPKSDKLYDVAKYLNKTVEYFLTGEDYGASNNLHNTLTNSIDESINNLTLTLSKQEFELILKYRKMTLKEQSYLLNYVLNIKNE